MTAANPYAPQYHFSPSKGWINDPNGLVFFNGEWHLFYQYYEPSMIDGMQWGHAVSSDLVKWIRLPPALQPDTLGQIWSGSAVVDQRDSSGLFAGSPGIVCLYTYWDKLDHRQSQGMAFSADGRTFTKYPGNPVIPQLRHLPGHPDDKDFRDPRVFRHEQSGRWIMAVAGGKLRFFSSTDLVHWEFESVDESIDTECPDLFALPVDGDTGRIKWVLNLGGRDYMIGEFDGRNFTPGTGRIPMSAGPDFYATQSWSDAPDGRRIIISWLFGWGYGIGLNGSGITNVFPTGDQSGGCLSVPYELSLRQTGAGLRLCMKSVPECDRIFSSVLKQEEKATVTQNSPLIVPGFCGAAQVRFTILHCESGRVGVRLEARDGTRYEFGYDAGSGCLFVDRRGGGMETVPAFPRQYAADPLGVPLPVDIHMLIDRCSVEIFANNGFSHLSAFILEPEGASLHLFADIRADLEAVVISGVEAGSRVIV